MYIDCNRIKRQQIINTDIFFKTNRIQNGKVSWRDTIQIKNSKSLQV